MNSVKLKEVTEILPSGISKFEGEKKYVDTRSVDGSEIIDYKLISYKNRPSRANIEVEKDCILFAKAKNTHKVFLVNSENVKNIYSTGFFALKPKKEKILPEYLYYYFSFNETELLKDRLAHGATQKAINNSDLNNKFYVNLAEISVQDRIVTQLKKIENISRRFQEQMNKSKFLLDTTRENLFGAVREHVLLADITKVLYRYPTFYGFKYTSEGVPVLKISNMTQDGKFLENEMFDHVPEEINKRYPKTIVSKGDLVMEVRGTYIGLCALVPKFLDGSNISPNTIRISLNSEKIRPEFFWHYTFTDGMKNQIRKRSNYWKKGFGTIKSSDLVTIEIPITSLDIQKSVVNRLNKIFVIYEQFSQNLKECQQLFQSILKKYFQQMH